MPKQKTGETWQRGKYVTAHLFPIWPCTSPMSSCPGITGGSTYLGWSLSPAHGKKECSWDGEHRYKCNHVIGASLSEPHTSAARLHCTCVCVAMLVCLQPYTVNLNECIYNYWARPLTTARVQCRHHRAKMTEVGTDMATSGLCFFTMDHQQQATHRWYNQFW